MTCVSYARGMRTRLALRFSDGERSICWSRDFGAPLVVRGAAGEEYTLTSIELLTRPIPALVPLGPEIGGDED